MSGRRTSFGKLERERAKKAKAAAKRENRFARPDADADPDSDSAPPETPVATSGASTGELLEKIEKLHQRFEARDISFEDFEEQKNELMSRLSAG